MAAVAVIVALGVIIGWTIGGAVVWGLLRDMSEGHLKDKRGDD